MLGAVEVEAIDEERFRKGALFVDTIGTNGNEAAKDEAEAVMVGASSRLDP